MRLIVSTGVLALFLTALVPGVIAWRPMVVVSGSMAPALRAGDVVLTSAVARDAVRPGDIVQVARDTDGPRDVLHRVVAVQPDGTLTTRGDATADVDSAPVGTQHVVRAARLRIPYIGLPAVLVRTAPGAAIGIIGATGATGALVGIIMVRRGAWRATPGRHRVPAAPRPRLSRRGAVTSCVVGLVASGSLTWGSSEAAFVGTASNPLSSWSAATVSMNDDDGGATPTTGTAMFSVTGLTPSSGASSRCIRVTYTGSVAAPVRLYAGNLTGTGLGTYLNLTVEYGSVGTFASCGAFSGSTLYNGTLSGFSSARTAWSDGLPTTWIPGTNGASAVFRFTYSLQNNTAARGLTCGLDFIWEAQA